MIPLNDALNKLLLDMLVASEFGAFPQRWATGIEQVVDANGKEISPFTGGAMGIWAVNSENAKFGDFTTTDLEQFVKLQESLRAEVARVASIPLHYLMLQSGNFPSGKALQTAERRFTIKIKMLQTKFGEVWAKAIVFALRLHEAKPNLRLITQWKDNTVISEKETFENLQMKRTALQIPFARLWEEAGYGAEQIKTMLEQRRAELSETPAEN